jgi:hypothetical protein
MTEPVTTEPVTTEPVTTEPVTTEPVLIGRMPAERAPASPGPDRRVSYEVRVRGHLGAAMLRAFPGLDAEIRGGDTLLLGAVADQAALHGVLARVEALGLELLEVRRLAGDGRDVK